MSKKNYDDDYDYDDYDDDYGGEKVSFFAEHKVKIIAIASAVLVFLVALTVGIVLLFKSCGGSVDDFPDSSAVDFYDSSYKSTTSVGYSSTQIGTTKRVKPVSETKNEGLNEYPEYGKSLESVLGDSAEQMAKRAALINEASYLTTTNTWNGGGGGYTWMDKNGFLYSGTHEDPVKTLDSNGNHRQLYKHSASVGLYGGDVSENEPGIIKKVTLNPRGYDSYSVTGVYAPAGEVIKIEISEEDMNANGGITIHIGQALYNGKANNIWTEKNQMQRFPILLNTMNVNKDTAVLKNGVYTAYVGSFLGGPLYIRNTKARITATISGGVTYSHFILGYTTKNEFEQNAKSSVPYFDLEVRSYGVLHSGPRKYADKYSYDELYKAAILWEKISLVSTTNSLQGIVFIYDPFVAAGAAVAFPGQQSVNCPDDWMDGSLNYDGLVTYGSWGNFHEYHHNFQGYGVGDGGEVTNNGMNLVSYALFTKISALRNADNFGASGLDGWNRYTSATWALEQVLKIARDGEDPENGNRGLALYATLLHNFGADNYIQSKVKQQKTGAYGEDYFGYMRAWQDITHNNMYYYFNDILKGSVENNAPANYPVFVPVSSVYQTGRSYMYDGEKKYITTMQPYLIPMGEKFTVDLNRYSMSNGRHAGGSIVLPEGFSFTVKGITNPEYGQLENNGNGTYTYTPDSSRLRSGKIIVTLKIDGPVKVDDVDLVLEFEQTREHNKNMLERTTYTYAAGTGYTDAVEAFNAGYAGFIEVIEKADNVNRTQNCNTDIWYTNNDGDVMPENAVVELSGKIYVDETAKYRIAIRGRSNVALFIAINDSENYELAAKRVGNSSPDFTGEEGTFKDFSLNAGDWVKFKAVMITGKDGGGRASYIGVGWGKFTPAEVTMDKDGNVVDSSTETVNVSYANAYRMYYEFPTEKFETDYFYTRTYTYDYKDNVKQTVNAPLNNTLADTNYSENIAWNKNDHKIENLFDGNRETYIHTNGNLRISNESPLNFTLDLGDVKSVNRIIFYTQYRPNGDWHCVKSFRLYGSTDGETYSLIGTFENVTRNDTTVQVNFEETSLRYCKIEIYESTGAYIILSEIELWRVFEVNGGNQLPPSNDMFSYEKNWFGKQTFSTFGHVYLGKNESKVSFEFDGTRLAILSSKDFKTDFEVYIDGKKVSSVGLKEDNWQVYVSFMSEKLESGKHKVEIKCKGEANFDSFVIFNEQN
ncbi:MAG: M60 family metallopeptidase [Clostridia bacterium]|nr:M60 family metallopeptidase [Clostridia bacterium]